MASTNVTLKPNAFGQTTRTGAWWLQPLLVFLALAAFVVYSTWAAFKGDHYRFGNYLSPMYSPEVFGDAMHSWFGAKPNWWPGWLLFSPALLILWAPGGFRLTCYYYRGSYYKSFWADPPACAVGEPRKRYLGERSFPLILQNVHRYFLYLALVFLVFLAHDAWKAMWFTNSAGGVSFGVGLGTIILTVNAVLLGGYTFSCHSLRHLVGGGCDQLSKMPIRQQTWRCVSCLNRKHNLWAWMSLFWVMLSDIFVRLCSMGIWSDWRLF